MAELVDARGLGSRIFGCAGSSPVLGTSPYGGQMIRSGGGMVYTRSSNLLAERIGGSNPPWSISLREWFNRGKNLRVPNEDTATWGELIKDDLSQLTHSNRAYSTGSTSVWSWRPLKAFSPEMFSTGPTPLVRQIVRRIVAPWRNGRRGKLKISCRKT